LLSPYFIRSNPANILKLDNTKELNEALLNWRDLYYLPHNWTLLHILALYEPIRLRYIPSFKTFKVPFLLDLYQKTPLHYLLIQRITDTVIMENLFTYIVDYLDADQQNLIETEAILTSLSNLLPFILHYFKTDLVVRYLNLANIAPRVPHGEQFPRIGVSKNKVITSEGNVLKDPKKIAKFDGKDLLEIRSVILAIDHRLGSNDSMNLLHILKNSSSEEIFETKAITKFIDHMWKLHRRWQAVIAFLYTVMVILLSIYIGRGEQGNLGLEISVNAISGVLLLLEIIQWIKLKKYYARNLFNLLDISITAYIMAVMIHLYGNNDTLEVRGWLFSACIFFSYARWLGFLRLFRRSSIGSLIY
jgi:hypothetical protein